MRKLDTRGDTPSMDADDSLKTELIEHPFRFREFLNETELTAQIVEAINRMSGAGESAEDEYRECLSPLIRQAKRVVQMIQAEYFDMPEESYLDRWALVMLAAELVDKRCVDFFQSILESEIPEERSKHPHSFTTVGEEIMIRTTAIEGLERLAQDDNAGAMEVLFKNSQHESFSIRRAATQALIAIGGEEMRERLANELPERHRQLLDIRRTDVRRAEQAKGGLFLKNRDGDTTPVPNDRDSTK